MVGAKSARSVQIATDHLTARVHPFGASLCDLRLTGHPHPLVQTYGDDAVPLQPNFAGAVIGRFANRIAGGRTLVAGQALTLERNDMGVNALHGGSYGFARRWWVVEEQADDAVTLLLHSHDGDAGYPGALTLRATYRITAPATLTLDITATTDATTIMNICHHPYFTFDGAETVSDHVLHIAADRYLPVDAALIPRNPQPVAGTAFDFRAPRPIGADGTLFNNTYCIGDAPWQPLRPVANLTGGDIRMTLSTTQAGLHFYDGYKVAAPRRAISGKQTFGPRSALCLEAQGWPNAPNRPDFPSALLEPEQTYHHRTEYAFSKSG